VIIDYSILINDGISQLDMDLMAGCGLRPATIPCLFGLSASLPIESDVVQP
jgi:hypothetical protein